MRYSLFVFTLFSFLLLSFSVAAYKLEEGEVQTYYLGGIAHEVEALLIEDTTPATVTFRVNGQVTIQLKKGQTLELPTDATLKVLEIILNEAGEAGLGDIVEFTFIDYCGDDICSADESCGTCDADCGCQNGEFCDGYQCRVPFCGDTFCTAYESCEQDRCCFGKETEDFDTSRFNCGRCGNYCTYGQACEEGVCIFKNSVPPPHDVCGDDICSPNDEECCADCGCEEGFSCQENFCIPTDKCKADKECADDNPCTADVCTGVPKDCQHQQYSGCPLENQCFGEGEVAAVGDVLAFCNEKSKWESQRGEGARCVSNNQCQSSICQEDACYVQRSFVSKVLRWFETLFSSPSAS